MSLFEKYIRLTKQLSPKANFYIVTIIGLILILGFQLIVGFDSPNATHEFEIKKEGLVASWTWGNGYNSPYIAKDNNGGFSFSAVESKAGPKGNTESLWSHYMGASSNHESIFSSYNKRDEYLVEQVTTLIDDRSLKVSFYVTSLDYFNEFYLFINQVPHSSQTIIVNDHTIDVLDEYNAAINGGENSDITLALSTDGLAVDINATTFNLLPKLRTLVFEEIVVFSDK